jgi:hypothetical protein
MNPTINILNVAKDKEWNIKQETTTQKTNKDMLETESSLELIDTERKGTFFPANHKVLYYSTRNRQTHNDLFEISRSTVRRRYSSRKTD